MMNEREKDWMTMAPCYAAQRNVLEELLEGIGKAEATPLFGFKMVALEMVPEDEVWFVDVVDGVPRVQKTKIVKTERWGQKDK